MKHVFFGLLLVSTVLSGYAYEFLYPITAYQDHKNTTKVLVLYQKSLAHVELWSWDPTTHRAVKVLLSSFSPAGIRMLPHDRGFSFIDNGRIRIKECIKRSPKSIDIYEPLSSIGLVTWGDDGIGYFSAKERSFYNIFSLTVAGDVTRCVSYSDRDCMYPCSIASKLFYIERVHVPQESDDLLLSGTSSKELYEYRVVESLQKSSDQGIFKHIVADFGQRPIIYLTMTSPCEGFIIEHEPYIHKTDATIDFVYYRLVREREDEHFWRQEHLFSFSIPSYLVLPTSDRRLHESMLPLLPRLVDRTVYYADSDKDSPSLFFVPVRVNSLLFFGGRILSDGPCMYFDQEDMLCFEFPSFETFNIPVTTGIKSKMLT